MQAHISAYIRAHWTLEQAIFLYSFKDLFARVQRLYKHPIMTLGHAVAQTVLDVWTLVIFSNGIGRYHTHFLPLTC